MTRYSGLVEHDGKEKVIAADSRNVIAETCGYSGKGYPGQGGRESNATRIVECWNACEGAEGPLTPGVLLGYQQAAAAAERENMRQAREIEALIPYRDLLLRLGVTEELLAVIDRLDPSTLGAALDAHRQWFTQEADDIGLRGFDSWADRAVRLTLEHYATDRPWFATSGEMAREIPRECVEACSHSGRCDDDVKYWRCELNFQVPRAAAVAFLAEYGAWDDAELAESTDDELADRVLWLACGDISDGGEFYGLSQ